MSHNRTPPAPNVSTIAAPTHHTQPGVPGPGEPGVPPIRLSWVVVGDAAGEGDGVGAVRATVGPEIASATARDSVVRIRVTPSTMDRHVVAVVRKG